MTRTTCILIFLGFAPFVCPFLSAVLFMGIVGAITSPWSHPGVITARDIDERMRRIENKRQQEEFHAEMEAIRSKGKADIAAIRAHNKVVAAEEEAERQASLAQWNDQYQRKRQALQRAIDRDRRK